MSQLDMNSHATASLSFILSCDKAEKGKEKRREEEENDMQM
jgi:hypothetical protein